MRIAVGRVLFAVGVAAVVSWSIYGAFAAFHPSWVQVAFVAWLTLSILGVVIACYLLSWRPGGQLAPALIGLLGVLIGGAITSGITYLGDRNRRHDEQRAAARLVIDEIQGDTGIMGRLGRPYGLLFFINRPPPVATAWHDEQGTLAKYLTDDQWDKVATFYLDVERTDAALANRNCRKHRSLGEALIGFDHGHDALVSLGARGPLPPRVSKQALQHAYLHVCLS
jgi:hypothetical protein